jgi:hypothetical protein
MKGKAKLNWSNIVIILLVVFVLLPLVLSLFGVKTENFDTPFNMNDINAGEMSFPDASYN